MVLYNPKCKTLFRRGDDFKVTDELTDPRFWQIGNWVATKKMDGTSVIISIHNGVDGGYSFHGRTAKSQFTPAMQQFLDDAASEALFSLADHGVYQADIYAELFGEGIQGNPHGMEGMHLRVFDVRIGDFWLDWENVEDVAVKAGLLPVDVLMVGSTESIVEYIKSYAQHKGDDIPYFEGVVARTDPLLYDNQGNRMMWKLKVSDYKGR